MKATKKILILGDSHSTNYGTRSYIEELNDQYEIIVLTAAGLPIQSMFYKLEQESITACFDFCIVQLGNPDVHPRFLLKHKRTFKRFFGINIRESFFSLPPRFGVKYIFKIIPAIIKKIYISLYSESYNSPDEIIKIIADIVSMINYKKLIVMPVFPVQPFIYGSLHNILAEEFNVKRHSLNGVCVNFQTEDLDYQADGFHFTYKMHRRIANELSKFIEL